MSGFQGPADGEEWLDRVEELLERVRLGESISTELQTLPPEVRQHVRAVVEGQGLLLGRPLPGSISLPLQPTPPTLLASRYRVLSELGRGGMGVVYRAEDLHQNRLVVIKVMTASKTWDPRLRVRFQREIRALRKIHRHPSVVEVLDAGEDPQQGPYLVMEFVQGEPLQSQLDRHKRLDPQYAIEIAADVARALAVVHRAGLIHRDVKPANVMILPKGGAKLVDFGLARDAFLTTITKAGHLLGTCYYMAPEQWTEDLREDTRCDVFALGATLYQMLVGVPPFRGADLGEVMEACLRGEYEPAENLAEGLPGDLPLVLHQMLAGERRYRYARMDDLAEDLDRVLVGERCRVPCLVDARGTRHVLCPGRRWRLGREGTSDVVLNDPTVSRQHAEVRREERGYVLRDLDSSYGTAIGGRALSEPCVLQGGDHVDLGDVRLTFFDPPHQPTPSSICCPVRRSLFPSPVIDLLVERGDPRAIASLLERLQPDLGSERLLRASAERLLGAEAAKTVTLGRARHAATVYSELTRLTGQVDPGGVPGWLAWWSHTRDQARDQAGTQPARRACLRKPVEGYSEGDGFELGQEALVHLGRGAACHLVLKGAQVSRLHATLMRLHARWVVRDEGSESGTFLSGAPITYAFLNPGSELLLGDVRLRLETLEPRVDELRLDASGRHQLDPASFEALREAGHASTATALVASLTEPPAWIETSATRLYPRDLAGRESFARVLKDRWTQRASDSRASLTRILGANPGTEPEAWSVLLEARSAALPPQVWPLGGWLPVDE